MALPRTRSWYDPATEEYVLSTSLHQDEYDPNASPSPEPSPSPPAVVTGSLSEAAPMPSGAGLQESKARDMQAPSRRRHKHHHTHVLRLKAPPTEDIDAIALAKTRAQLEDALDQVAVLESEKDRLWSLVLLHQKARAQSDAACAAYQNDLAAKTLEAAKLRQEMREKLSAAEGEQRARLQQIETLKKLLEDKATECSMLMQQMSGLQMELERLRQVLHDERTLKTALEGDLARARATNDFQAKELTAMQAENSQLAMTNKQQADTIAALTEQLKDSAAQLAVAQSMVTERTTAAERALIALQAGEAQVQQMSSQVQELKVRLNVQDAMLARNQSEIQEAQQRIQVSETNAQAATARAVRLEAMRDRVVSRFAQSTTAAHRKFTLAICFAAIAREVAARHAQRRAELAANVKVKALKLYSGILRVRQASKLQAAWTKWKEAAAYNRVTHAQRLQRSSVLDSLVHLTSSSGSRLSNQAYLLSVFTQWKAMVRQRRRLDTVTRVMISRVDAAQREAVMYKYFQAWRSTLQHREPPQALAIAPPLTPPIASPVMTGPDPQVFILQQKVQRLQQELTASKNEEFRLMKELSVARKKTLQTPPVRHDANTQTDPPPSPRRTKKPAAVPAPAPVVMMLPPRDVSPVRRSKSRGWAVPELGVRTTPNWHEHYAGLLENYTAACDTNVPPDEAVLLLIRLSGDIHRALAGEAVALGDQITRLLLAHKEGNHATSSLEALRHQVFQTLIDGAHGPIAWLLTLRHTARGLFSCIQQEALDQRHLSLRLAEKGGEIKGFVETEAAMYAAEDACILGEPALRIVMAACVRVWEASRRGSHAQHDGHSSKLVIAGDTTQVQVEATDAGQYAADLCAADTTAVVSSDFQEETHVIQPRRFWAAISASHGPWPQSSTTVANLIWRLCVLLLKALPSNSAAPTHTANPDAIDLYAVRLGASDNHRRVLDIRLYELLLRYVATELTDERLQPGAQSTRPVSSARAAALLLRGRPLR